MKTLELPTITLGTAKPDLSGVYTSSWAQDLLDKITYQLEREKIELVVKTPVDLGLTSFPTIMQIFDTAKEQGYDLCPVEIGPRLREAYKDDKWLWIAMEPITDRDGCPGVFYLDGGGGELGLYADVAKPDVKWRLGSKFVFRVRKSLKNSTSSVPLGSSDTLALEKRVAALEAVIKHHNL